MATRSRAFGAKAPRKAHLIKPAGGVAAEVYDARKDIEEAFTTLEGRSGGYPEIDWIDGGHAAAAGGDIIVKGRNLLQGQSFAALDIDSTYGLILTALKPGEDANDLTIEIISGAGTGVVKTGNAIAITFNDGTDDDDAIATAINAAGADTDGVLRAVSSGSKNAAAWTAAGALAATNLAGGEGEGFVARVSGEECLPANNGTTSSVASVTDTAVTVTVPDLTALGDARAVGDVAAVTVESDAVRAQQLTTVLA